MKKWWLFTPCGFAILHDRVQIANRPHRRSAATT
jgi:hypothetical protein